MSDASIHGTPTSTGTTNLPSTIAIAAGLVAVNVLLMLLVSYTPAVAVGRVLFSSFVLGVGTFVVTVGGGHWLATTGVEEGNVGLAGVGVAAIQAGYGLFGATLLASVTASLRVPALGITAVVTALLTAAITAVVYRVDHSFRRWNYYAAGLFGVGVAVGLVGVFVLPVLSLLAGPLFFLGFVAYFTHEIWAVKTSARGGSVVNAIGIYVAVMGIFVHVLSWVLRLLSLLDQ